MKYIKITLLLFMVFWMPFFTQAHETKTQNPLSVLLHIEPDDDPIAGQPAELFFAFTDEKNMFEIETCDCMVVVLDDRTVVFEGQITRSDESLYGKNVASMTGVFPRTGVYHVTLKATPRSEAQFSATTFSYDVEVKRDALPVSPLVTTSSDSKSTDTPIPFHVFGICAGCVVFLGVGLMAVRTYRKRVV